jgi:queuine tRNA-ribosyltransferase
LDKCFNRLAETPDLYGHTQNLFPIVQGGTYADLRKASCEYISSKNAVGNAIGGLSVGESEQELYDFTQLCCENLPVNKPRYLMGVGTPWNILEAIDLGVDMFDCVMPTRNGRNGMVFTSQGVINIKNKQWASDFSPLDPGLPNELSQYYTKAYMRHLFMADEILGLQLASIQNLSFYLCLVGQAREHIIAGDYASWKKTMVAQISKRL